MAQVPISIASPSVFTAVKRPSVAALAGVIADCNIPIAPGVNSSSLSRKSTNSPLLVASPSLRAWPGPPDERRVANRTRGLSAASSLTICAVSSVEPSSTTMISPTSGCEADAMVAAIVEAALYAGITTETVTGNYFLTFICQKPSPLMMRKNRGASFVCTNVLVKACDSNATNLGVAVEPSEMAIVK